MRSKHRSDLFELGCDILGTTINGQGTILCQTGDVNGDEVVSDGAEWWQHVGFASRPAKAIAGKSACQGLTINQGSADICIATRDIRGGVIYGALKEGESCVYAGGPANTGTGRILLKDDGTKSTITILTQKDNGASGEPILIQVSSEGKVLITAGSKGAITIDDGGIKLASNSDLQMGATGNVALIGAAMALNSAAVSLGAAASDGVALGPALVAWATAVNLHCAAVMALLNAPGPVTGAPGAVPVVPPLAPTAVSTSVKAAH